MFIVSNLLFRVAKNACITAEEADRAYRLQQTGQNLEPLQNAALSAIVFSTTSIESYLNEFTQIASEPVVLLNEYRQPSGTHPQGADISALASTLKQMEQKRQPAWKKFNAIRQQILGPRTSIHAQSSQICNDFEEGSY